MSVAISEQQTRNKIHPHKFALWVACASITMMFMAWTSAYVVRQAAGNFSRIQTAKYLFYKYRQSYLLSSVDAAFVLHLFSKEEKRICIKDY